MSVGGPYLGSKISLISKADIRYEGILYTIDTHECTVALAKVRTFGTEDRPAERPVPARDEIFEYIIFRGRDIKDLHVCEGPCKATPPQEPDPPQDQDPAIVKSSLSGPASSHGYQAMSAPQQLQKQTQSAPGSQSTTDYACGGQAVLHPPTSFAQVTGQQPSQQHQAQSGLQGSAPPARGSPSTDHHHHRQQQYQRQDGSHQNHPIRQNRGGGGQRGGRQPRGGGGFRSPRGGYRGRGGPRPNTGSRTLEFDGEFDFESANAEFEKEDLEKEMKQKCTIGDKAVLSGDKESDNEQEVAEEDGAEEEVFYDKTKSFFDNISCEATERAKGISSRPNWREERKLNTETFGQSGNLRRGGRGGMRGGYNFFNNRRGTSGSQYRGRGRGGQNWRGRGRGGNRGGRPRSQGWVDYDFDYAAAGIERNNLNSKPAAAAKS